MLATADLSASVAYGGGEEQGSVEQDLDDLSDLPDGGAETYAPLHTADLSSSAMHRLWVSSAHESSRASKHVRVLWDIENVPVPRHTTPLGAVQGLRDFLHRSELDGVGVDLKISAFHCLLKRGLSYGTIQQLDHAGVEQIMCSRKQEDADRKICARIDHEALVLPKETTTVSFESFDHDRRHARRCTMHNAQHARRARDRRPPS